MKSISDSSKKHEAMDVLTPVIEFLTENDSHLAKIFEPKLISCQICTECQKENEVTEPYHEIHLNIDNNCTSLDKLLHNFVAPEQVALNCNNCTAKTAYKT